MDIKGALIDKHSVLYTTQISTNGRKKKKLNQDSPQSNLRITIKK